MRILAVNAGSSSLKLRVVGPAGVRRRTRPTCRAARRGRRRSGEAVGGLGRLDAVGHRVVHGGTRFTAPVLAGRRRRRRDPRADAPGAAPPAARAGRDRRDLGAAPGRAAGRLLRHRVPRDAAAGRRHVCRAARVARALGRAPVRVPRAVARVRVAPGRRAAGARSGPGTAGRDVPPGGGGIADGGARRSLGGHDDGLHAARGAGDGDPVRDGRPGAGPVARDGARRVRRRS